MTKVMDLSELRAYIGSTIFGLHFVKRSTGLPRIMTARFNITKGLTGAGAGYDPSERNLVCVYDMDGGTNGTKGYKMIPLDGVIDVTVRGEKFHYVPEQGVFVKDDSFTL